MSGEATNDELCGAFILNLIDERPPIPWSHLLSCIFIIIIINIHFKDNINIYIESIKL